MICVPITEATQAEAIGAILRIAPVADAIELRMDLIRDGDLPHLIDAARRASDRVRVIVTCRRPDEAILPVNADPAPRKKAIPKAAKMKLLKETIRLGADFADIELAEGEKSIRTLLSFRNRQKSKTQIIVSWHDIVSTPSPARLKEIFRACESTEPDVIKIVTMAKTPQDNLNILSLIPYAKARGRKIIAMGMGEAGKLSRAMAPLLGSALAFAVLPGGKASAPGQLSVGVMRRIQNLLGNDFPRTQHPHPGAEEAQNFVLLGNPVRHSLSPLMHNTALSAMNLKGHYSAYCVTDVEAAIAGIRGLNIRGASVTIPFKTEVMEYLDDIDPDARALGAVNTIVNTNGILTGYNTDWLGLMQAIQDVLTPRGKTFAILGAGGTARAAAYGIAKAGGHPLIVNRTQDKGRALAAHFGCPFYPLDGVGKIKADVLINTTSVGLYPQLSVSPVDASILSHFAYVLDVIYNPLKTKLLRDAEAKGCQTISGLEMFIHQGAGQLKLWTGQDAPVALMRKTVRERLEAIESGN